MTSSQTPQTLQTAPNQHEQTVSDRGNYLRANMGRQFLFGNSVDILNNGEEIFPAMLEAIDQAKHHIEFQTYVYWDGQISREFARHLAAACKRGVEVRVLIDSFGALYIDKGALKELSESCDFRWFRKLKLFQFWRNFKRTHRKILVCDGELGFTGGVGIGKEWMGGGAKPGEWRDTHFRLKGPVIHALQAAFLENWLEAGQEDDRLTDKLARACTDRAGQVTIMPLSSTASDYWSSAGTLIFAAVAAANKKLRITTPYFVTDLKLRQWLISAHERGVDVQIMIPDFPNFDSRLASLAAINCVQPLLKLGIKIYTYKPTFIHSKCIIVDDEVAIVGSINFNQRSQRKDDEFSLIIDEGPIVNQLISTFKKDREKSTPIKIERLKRRYRVLGVLARLVHPFRRHF